MFPVLLLIFSLMAVVGFLMSSTGRDMLKAMGGAPTDEKRATKKHHQMAVAQARMQRRVFGKR